MRKKIMQGEWEDGAELSQSRKTPGKKSPLTRDGDNNLGQVVLSDVDDDDYEYDWQTAPEPDPKALWHINANGEVVLDPGVEALVLGAIALLGVIVAATEKAAPH